MSLHPSDALWASEGFCFGARKIMPGTSILPDKEKSETAWPRSETALI